MSQLGTTKLCTSLKHWCGYCPGTYWCGPCRIPASRVEWGLPHLPTAHRTESRELRTLKELRIYKRLAGLREKSTQSIGQTRETKPWIHQEEEKEHAGQWLHCLLAPTGVPYPRVIPLSWVFTQLSFPLWSFFLSMQHYKSQANVVPYCLLSPFFLSLCLPPSQLFSFLFSCTHSSYWNIPQSPETDLAYHIRLDILPPPFSLLLTQTPLSSTMFLFCLICSDSDVHLSPLLFV